MAFFSKKQHEWNPPWKSADEVFSEDFGKLLIKDLKYLEHHPERWEFTYLRISDLNTAKNLTSNRPYCGDNQTLLKKHTSTHLYAMPVYVTEKQLAYRYPKAKILYKDAWVNITYYNKTYKDKNGNEITEAQETEPVLPEDRGNDRLLSRDSVPGSQRKMNRMSRYDI